MVTSTALLLGLCLISVTSAREECTEIDVTDKEGELTSPNFPHLYYPNTCIVWTFVRSYKDVVTISFTQLDLPKDLDTGLCTRNHFIIHSHGVEHAICGQTAKPFISSHEDMNFYLRFLSGSTPAGRGFRLSYIIGPLDSLWCKHDQHRCRSGKCIPHRWLCNGQEECEDGDDEDNCYGNWKTSSPRPLIPSLATVPPVQQQNTAGNTCHHVLHNATGRFELHIPATGNGYDYTRCFWLIDIPGNVINIELRFLHINIPSDSYIRVYKGTAAISANEIGKFSPSQHVQTITTASNIMFVDFWLTHHYSYPVVGDLFFSAEYTAYRMDPDSLSGRPSTTNSPRHVNDCFYQLYHRHGNFTMPPSLYHPADVRDCTWHILKPYTDSHIHLLFTFMSLQDGDSIHVYDGRSELDPSLGVFTHRSSMPLPVSVRSSGRNMLVKFFSHERKTSIGSHFTFEAQYHFEDVCELYGEIHCGDEDNICYRPAQHCDGVWDCPLSGADEEGCYGCPENSYNCEEYELKEGVRCYSKRDRCSGASVCASGADENNCNEQLCSETRNLFLCANKYCIMYDLICDGTNDCGDNSDEEGCSLGSSRKVIVAAVVGSLLCSLLLVLSLGCACKFYYMRHNQNHRQHHHHHRSPRYDTPLTRLQAEMFRRRAPPPPYHEAMITSRPYDEAVREYLAQTQQNQQQESPGQEGRDAEQSESVNSGAENDGRSVQNLISLVDFAEEASGHREITGETRGQHEMLIVSDTSNGSDSEDEDNNDYNVVLVEDESGQIEMTENLGRRRPVPSHHGAEDDGVLAEITSEDSASATLSADGTDMLSPADDQGKNKDPEQEESCNTAEQANESDKDDSDADSVCILCLDEDPAALDDGSDTRCLLQDV